MTGSLMRFWHISYCMYKLKHKNTHHNERNFRFCVLRIWMKEKEIKIQSIGQKQNLKKCYRTNICFLKLMLRFNGFFRLRLRDEWLKGWIDYIFIWTMMDKMILEAKIYFRLHEILRSGLLKKIKIPTLSSSKFNHL